MLEKEFSYTTFSGVTIKSSSAFAVEYNSVYGGEYFYIFNDNGISGTVGGVFKFETVSGTCVDCYNHITYSGVTSAVYNNSTTPFSVSTPYIVYYNGGDNIYFVDTNGFYNRTSMIIDNIKADASTIIPIRALAVKEENLYRLQQAACFFGTDYTWTNYNYQLSTITTFMDSMTMALKLI
jgi:hypothetical protein